MNWRHTMLILIQLTVLLAGCGGGGSSNDPSDGSGGSLGGDSGGAGGPTVLTVGTSLDDTIPADGINQYQFTTGAAASTHVISLTGVQSDLAWNLYSDSGFTMLLESCDDFADVSDESCETASLDANTTYYLDVEEWSGVAGSFSILVATSGGGGSLPPPSATPTSAPVPRTGQTTCYDSAGSVVACAGSGQDGELQVGVAWPSPRFIANLDTTITDNLTGLIWAPNGNLMPSRNPGWDTDFGSDDGLVSWSSALAYIAKLNMESYLGHTDWRLPNANELRSLAHYGVANSAAWLMEPAQGFSIVGTANYWSSTTYTGSTGGGVGVAWIGELHYGWSNILEKDGVAGALVFPVRTTVAAAASLSLPRTGQDKCYDALLNEIVCAGTGQDGESQAGAAWPASRFVANVDTSITDMLTGLTWAPQGNLIATRDLGYDVDGTADDGAVYWQTALNYVAKLNSESYLGHTDWRLPNANELRSLAHFGVSDSAAWLMEPAQGFSDVQASYWSSTTITEGLFNSRALVLYISAPYAPGQLLIAQKQDVIFQYSVWPVRGGL